MKNKKDFIYSREEIYAGKTRFGTPVFDGTFALVDKDKFVRVKEQGNVGTHLVKRNGKTFKIKGGDCLSTSIDVWF